jgi:hypothetical protein
MTKEELMGRLKQYALSVARLVLKLPYNIVNKNIQISVIVLHPGPLLITERQYAGNHMLTLLTS